MWETIVDAVSRFFRRFRTDPTAGARVELAIIGRTLPRVLNGSSGVTPDHNRPIADPTILVSPAAVEGVASLDGEGLGRMLRFDDGSSLEDLVRSGVVSSVATLVTELERLAGVGNVTWNGNSTAPEIRIVLTKTLSGSADFDLAFEQFGGSVALGGGISMSVDAQLDLTFGANLADGAYIRTDGAAPELSLSNISLVGQLRGEGHFGFLDVELINPTLTVSGVTVALNLDDTVDDMLTIADLVDPDVLANLGTPTVTGSAGYDVEFVAGIKARALFPGGGEPFDLPGASIEARWPDITAPTNVEVTVNGTIGDFLKVKVHELLTLLRQLRDGTQQLGDAVPESLRDGLEGVIGFLELLDSTTNGSLSTSPTGHRELQDRAGRRAAHGEDARPGPAGLRPLRSAAASSAGSSTSPRRRSPRAGSASPARAPHSATST